MRPPPPPTTFSIGDMVLADRRVTIDAVASSLNISHGFANKIIHHELNFRKVCARACCVGGGGGRASSSLFLCYTRTATFKHVYPQKHSFT